jgi:hypothetical protein
MAWRLNSFAIERCYHRVVCLCKRCYGGLTGSRHPVVVTFAAYPGGFFSFKLSLLPGTTSQPPSEIWLFQQPGSPPLAFLFFSGIVLFVGSDIPAFRQLGKNLLERACSHRLSARCWPVKPKSSPRGFFIGRSDRTPPVSMALESVAGKKRHLALHPSLGLSL